MAEIRGGMALFLSCFYSGYLAADEGFLSRHTLIGDGNLLHAHRRQRKGQLLPLRSSQYPALRLYLLH